VSFVLPLLSGIFLALATSIFLSFLIQLTILACRLEFIELQPMMPIYPFPFFLAFLASCVALAPLPLWPYLNPK